MSLQILQLLPDAAAADALLVHIAGRLRDRIENAQQDLRTVRVSFLAFAYAAAAPYHCSAFYASVSA